MQEALQITFRDIPHSDAVEAAIRDKAEKLNQFFEKILFCRVMVEAPHSHHHQGRLYRIRVDIGVPGTELVVSRAPAKHQAHEDIYVAIRDAFDAMRRQLQDYNRKLKRKVKTHVPPAHGKVTELEPAQGYGRILSSDGRDIYFHRNSLVRGDYGDLEIGSEVRFVEEAGDLGPQASTVHVVAKHHIVE